MKCSFCDRRAVYYAPHFNRLFCASHLENFLLKKLKREIYRHRLVRPRDTFLFLSNFINGRSVFGSSEPLIYVGP